MLPESPVVFIPTRAGLFWKTSSAARALGNTSRRSAGSRSLPARPTTTPEPGIYECSHQPEPGLDGSPASADTPRPLAPNFGFVSYDVKDSNAMYVRLRVLDNQCTGGPAYQWDPDAEPSNDSDCESGSDEDLVVRAAELDVFAQ